MMRADRFALLLILMVLFGGHAPTLLAGDLEPPGPPEPTMKPLDEMEPRIPILAEDLPLTITDPGSYYLADNIETEAGGGEEIGATGVRAENMDPEGDDSQFV